MLNGNGLHSHTARVLRMPPPRRAARCALNSTGSRSVAAAAIEFSAPISNSKIRNPEEKKNSLLEVTLSEKMKKLVFSLKEIKIMSGNFHEHFLLNKTESSKKVFSQKIYR